MSMNSPDNPYMTGTAQAPVLDTNDGMQQFDRFKKEERDHRSPKILPFELNRAIQAIGDAFVNLTELKNAINSIKQRNGVRKDLANDIISEINEINSRLVNLPKLLDKIAL